MKKFVSISFVFMIVLLFTACSRIPFNGDIEFHDISLTIPERFIRDSVQSNNELWVFEHDNYSEYVIVSRKGVTGEVSSVLADYVEYMKDSGAESGKTLFLDKDAVLSTYYKGNEFCQEILFAYNGYFYSVALRGGTQDGFEEITDTINLIELAADRGV